MLIQEKEVNALATIANATELAAGVVQALVGEELGNQFITENGRAGLNQLILSRIQTNISKELGV